MSKEITHGVSLGITPEEQTREYISDRLALETEISLKLTPHLDSLQSQVAEAVCAVISNSEVPKVIEIGVGTGATTIGILERDATTSVVAVDLNRQRLERAQFRLEKYAERVSFIESDAFDYLSSLPDNSADCIYTAFTLHNLPLDSRMEIINRLYTVLKPSGVYIDADKHGTRDEGLNRKLLNEQISTIEQNIEDKELSQQWVEHYKKDAGIDQTREDYCEYLEKLGFKVEVLSEQGLEVVITATKI